VTGEVAVRGPTRRDKHPGGRGPAAPEAGSSERASQLKPKSVRGTDENVNRDLDETTWFYATLITKIVVEGDPRNVMHADTILVRARDIDDAYFRALDLGSEQNRDDVNPQGKRVSFAFVGLSELALIDNTLEHGTEILFTEKIGLSNKEIEDLVLSRERLCEPTTAQLVDKPDYRSMDVVDAMKKLARGGEEPPN